MKKYRIKQELKVSEELKNSIRLKNMHPVTLEVLAKRGVTTEQQVSALLDTTLDMVLDSSPLKDTEKAVSRLKLALERKEEILVFRDYDCDGCCAGAIAMECLSNLGGNVSHICNDRKIDGYGMSSRMIDIMLKEKPNIKLIITVDNGIVAYDSIDHAISRGLDVIVTDHHMQGETLPNALAVVNPRRNDETAEFRELCGAGVIFKVMLSLYREMDLEIRPVLKSLDLVALATVADVMKLEGDNRVLIQEGISLMLQETRPFFSEFIRQKKIKKITAHGEIAFQIAPLVNAVSRMEHDTAIVVNAFLSKDPTFLERRVTELIEINEQRKELSNIAERDVLDICQNSNPPVLEMPALLVLAPTVPSGLSGIVAGRLTEEYHKISGVFHSEGNGLLKASMRGIDGFNIKLALDKITKGLLVGYGGHEKAAGLTIREENFEQFKREFDDLVKEAFPNGTGNAYHYLDSVLTEDSCTFELLDSLSLFEPYGENFPAPRFGINANITDRRFMGKNQEHVKYTSDTGMVYLHFRYGEESQKRTCPPSKFVGILDINEFNGKKSIQFNAEYEE